jgi:hypothetical protein
VLLVLLGSLLFACAFACAPVPPEPVDASIPRHDASPEVARYIDASLEQYFRDAGAGKRPAPPIGMPP